MSPRRTIIEALKDAGFWFVRKGKHEVWSNGKWNVPVPTGNGMSQNTLIAVLQHIQGKGPFFNRQQANKISNERS